VGHKTHPIGFRLESSVTGMQPGLPLRAMPIERWSRRISVFVRASCPVMPMLESPRLT